MPNKHQLRTEATKGKLFAAAERVFAKCGFEAATIGQIARTAGFTRGAFYAHFKTKEDLFLGMLEDRASVELKRLRTSIEASSKNAWRDMIWQVCREKLRDTQWSILQIEFKLYMARRGAKGAKIAERYQSLRENMRQQYLDDLIPKNPLKHALFEAVTDGLSLQRAYKRSHFPEQTAEEAMRHAFEFLVNWE